MLLLYKNKVVLLSSCNQSVAVGVGVVFASLVINPKLIAVQKRTLLRAVRQRLFHTEPKFLHGNRNMATWATCRRKENATIGKHIKKLEVDEDTGLEIMNPVDLSGKNHYLLTDKDFKSDKFVKIYGSFTTSTASFNDEYPLMVDSYTLEGQNTPQLFHAYKAPKLLRKEHMRFDELTTYSLSGEEYIKFLRNLEKQHGLHT